MLPVIIYIMGVSGSGKTTIGKRLAMQTGIPFFDGDDFHPVSNITKMKAGQPLTDEDRIDWLRSINKLARQSSQQGAIIACSALKEKYRDMLTADITIPVHWIFLNGSYQLISKRMQQRKDHFMPPGLLQSQFEILEIPQKAMMIDITNTTDSIIKTIMEGLRLSS